MIDLPLARPRRSLAALVAAAASLVATGAAATEPWSDADPREPPRRYVLGDFGFRGGAEYRAQLISITPLALASDVDPNALWIEHRLRLDASADYRDKVRVVASVDALSGVLWGDNGDFGGTPSSLSGTNVAAKNPNVTSGCVGLVAGDPLASSSYGLVPCTQAPIVFRKAYGEVMLPFGLLRVGRQPVSPGTGVQAADGDGRPNRFGVSDTGNLVDRVLFATKPLEAGKPKDERDLSEDGLVLAVAYDRLVTDSPQIPGAAVNQADVAVRYRAPRYALGEELFASAYYVRRWDQQYATQVNSFGARAMSRFGAFHAGFDAAMNVGSTREVAVAYQVVANDPVVDQPILQGGARAVLRYDRRFWSAYLEGDFASGDSDPTVRKPLTQFVFATDTNVGLLLFKRVLAFQSARAAAAAVELLRRLGATTYPAETIDTRGAFTDAMALFPQLDVHPHESVLLRGGVLMAWAPEKAIDPIASLKARDGVSIQDHLVNFAGGKPGRYYGTELDGRAQWRAFEHFAFDLEGAILFPGDALQNVDGYAVRSVLVQARTTFFL